MRLSTLGKEAVRLQTEIVPQKPMWSTISVPGKIELLPTLEFQQHAILSGRITEILVNLGDSVKKGQPLAMMESPELNKLAAETIQSSAQIKAEIAQNRAQLDDEVNQAVSRRKVTEAAYYRAKILQEEKIGARKTTEMALSEYEVSQSRLIASQKKRQLVLAALQEKLEITLHPLRQRLKLLGLTEPDIAKLIVHKQSVLDVPVLSSHSGTVASIDLAIGQSVEPTVQLFTISDLSRVWIRANVYESDVAAIRKGQSVKIRLKSLPNQHLVSSITYIAPHIDPQLRTLSVCAELPNPEFLLKPGMYGVVDIETTKLPNALIVPFDAVVRRDGETYVYIEHGDGFLPVAVTVGRVFDHQIEIILGLKPGQKVVIHGAFQIDAEAQKNKAGPS